jgi:hypothetical protein
MNRKLASLAGSGNGGGNAAAMQFHEIAYQRDTDTEPRSGARISFIRLFDPPSFKQRRLLFPIGRCTCAGALRFGSLIDLRLRRFHTPLFATRNRKRSRCDTA